MLPTWVGLVAALTAVAARASDSGPFTLEQVLSAPFASELVAAPAAGKVGWVVYERGTRNVWVAGPPDYRGRRVTSYRDDDGQDISDLAWTPDAGAIVYVRGREANAKGEYPNPTSSPEGATQAVWIARADGGEPRRLGEGSAPAVSPRGDSIAFLRAGKIWSAPLDGSGEPKLLVQARGNAGSLRWSPDGGRLAFVSSRGDHAFVGVYDVAGRSVRYLDPDVDEDGSPAWSPDGRSVAFVRIPTAPHALPFTPRRTGQAWSIRVADAATGEGRLVWRAMEGRGSVFRELDSEHQIRWTADDRLVFPWEADGWTHLYSVPAAGGEATLLTPGAFEVENVALAADRKELLFSSNQDDVDRRHVWRVPAGSGRPVSVTSGGGLEWAPVATNDGKAVALLRSDARRPARAAIVVVAAAPRDLAQDAATAGFPEKELVEPQAVVFSAADGLRIHGQLFLPPGGKPGERRPAVLFFHGGSRRQMLLGWHYMQYYNNAYAMNQYLASRGYVVLSVNYRSGIGYGMEFREAEAFGVSGASEFADVMGAGHYLRGRADVDPDRIGLWGGSYGGYLTALGLARASSLFAAGVDIHGVHDWNAVLRQRIPDYDVVGQKDALRAALESSPVASLKLWRSPVLLIHGDDDRNVPFRETVTLAAALREQGVLVEERVFPDEIHGFLIHARWIEAYRAAARFFDRHLATSSPPRPSERAASPAAGSSP